MANHTQMGVNLQKAEQHAAAGSRRQAAQAGSSGRELLFVPHDPVQCNTPSNCGWVACRLVSCKLPRVQASFGCLPKSIITVLIGCMQQHALQHLLASAHYCPTLMHPCSSSSVWCFSMLLAACYDTHCSMCLLTLMRPWPSSASGSCLVMGAGNCHLSGLIQSSAKHQSHC
jgi:hypothetical protein